MQRMVSFLTILVLAAAGAAACVVPAFGAGGGSVNAKVVVAAPCITVGPSTGVDFGTAGFATATAPVLKAGSPKISVTNCSGVTENLYARGTDATSSTSSATWTLYVCCLPGQNLYMLRIFTTTPTARSMTLSKISDLFRAEAPGASETLSSELRMPLTGSAGAGETMTMQVLFTAAL